MLSYLGQRFLTLIIVMIVVTMIIFALMHAVPGGPFSQTQQPLPAFAMHNIMVKYGLDQPIYVQYLKWVWAALHGDFGIPFEEPTETVTQLIAKAWPVTLAVGAWTVLISYVGGIALGLISAIKQNTWIDWFLTSFATTGIALPNYVVGFLLIAIFAVSLGWLPTGGWGQPQDLILPVIAFALNPMALCARYTRASALEVTHADYVQMGRARGLPEWRINLNYVLRTALIPLITILGPNIPNLLTGSIFIEATFALPGLGSYFTTAILRRDYPMIMTLVLIVAVLWGTCYILSDVAYTLVDPRVRLEGVSR